MNAETDVLLSSYTHQLKHEHRLGGGQHECDRERAGDREEEEEKWLERRR